MRHEDLQSLFDSLSLEEKIGELVQLPPSVFNSDNATGPMEEMGLTPEEVALTGSTLTIIGAKKLRAIQETHIKNHPHHIPMLFMADIINGYKTVFPVPLAQGATFNPDLSEEAASVAAREAAAAGVHVTFSPMADLCRDPRWGRIMEGTGEDPYLNGKMAAAMVRGYQGPDNDLTEKGRLGSCVKHFAAYSAPNAGRDYHTVELSERTLREDYLTAYQSAVDAGCALVMTSFNTLDRVPSSANKHLCRDILRKEMGFDGVLISDWAAIRELINHGVAEDAAEASRLALEAGVDIDMATNCYLKSAKALIERGRLSPEIIDECAFRVLELKNRLGLFENPYKDASEEDEQALLLKKEHRDLARKCAEESFVLLENKEDTLPFCPKKKTALIGPFADNHKLLGGWSFFADDSASVTLRQGIEEAFPGISLTCAPGCPELDPGMNVVAFQGQASAQAIDTPEKAEAALKEAVRVAAEADQVILAIGETRDYTGESTSRTTLTLPEGQLRLLKAVAEAQPNLAVVLFGGRPLDLREVKPYARALLLAWLPGTEGGSALARTLFGLSAPSGRLPASFPFCVGQVPVHYSALPTGRPLHGDYLGKRFFSQYIDAPNEPLYPFGYGLGYTGFAFSPVSLDKDSLRPGETLTASVRVSNTGSREGTAVVQLYIRDCVGSVSRPLRELKGFEKITLAPGESQTVRFPITEETLRFWTLDMRYAAEPGEFRVFIGPDSATENGASFRML